MRQMRPFFMQILKLRIRKGRILEQKTSHSKVPFTAVNIYVL